MRSFLLRMEISEAKKVWFFFHIYGSWAWIGGILFTRKIRYFFLLTESTNMTKPEYPSSQKGSSSSSRDRKSSEQKYHHMNLSPLLITRSNSPQSHPVSIEEKGTRKEKKKREQRARKYIRPFLSTPPPPKEEKGHLGGKKGYLKC